MKRLRILDTAELDRIDRSLTSFNKTIWLAHQSSAQLKWLSICIFFNGIAVGVDRLALNDEFGMAVAVRALVLTPLMLAGVSLLLWWPGTRLQSLMTGTATVAFVAIIASIGQYAIEPFGTRYIMISIFTLFGAILYAGLPLRQTRTMYVISSALFAAIVVSSLKLTIVYNNIDLIFLCFATSGLALVLRTMQDSQKSRILGLRRIDAEQSILLNNANRELERLANIDPLTELFNRRYLDDYNKRFSSALVPSSGYCVLMIDVDHFKRLNDYSGHSEGDRCLRLIAKALRNGQRSDQDIVVRYGGEEFAVILPDAEVDAGIAVAERLRAAVADLRIPHPALGPDACISVSIGAHGALPTEPVTEALRQADAALYLAKQSGRNRVSVLPPTSIPSVPFARR